MRLVCVDIRLGEFYLAKERPGVISEESVWMLGHGSWMYGPYAQLWRCVKDMLLTWKQDKNLVG